MLVIISLLSISLVVSAAVPSTKPAALPICLYGSGCRSNADCISGSKCVSSSPFYSQCVLDTASELKSNCVRNYAPGCGRGAVCCNSGFSCNANSMSCVPVPAPRYCSNTLVIKAQPVVEKFSLILKREVLPGSSKITVNGTVPGPPIHITQGHLAEITVINQLSNNESATIHWHGMFQNQSSDYDGVPELDQSVIPSAQGQNTMVYKFMPNPAG